MGGAAAPRADSTPTVTRAELSDANDWNAFVESHPDATGYHLWTWRRVFEAGLGHRCPYLIARRGRRIVGVLPLVEVRSRLFGTALSSLPYVNYGGLLAIDADVNAALAASAAALATDRACSCVLFRHRSRLLPDRPVRTHKVTMLLELPASVDDLWNGLDRKVRNQIRKAEKSGVAVASGGVELLDEFYRIFAVNMRDLGTPVYGRALFRSILEQFPADARLHLARLNGEPIAGALSYAFRNWIEVPSASSLRAHRSLCPNHLLYWSVLREAIGERRVVFDFGRSTPQDGTYQFKEQWGARPLELPWEYMLSAGASLPTDDRHSPRYERLIAAWKRLPVPLATRIGPSIARLIP
jgi:serine/alanine adding enzyme